MYHKVIKNGYVLQNTLPEHAEALGALQQKVFPTLSPDELMQAKHYRKHVELFPEGQFVVLDGDQCIGMSTTIRHELTLADHTFREISGELWMTTHDPAGDWLYGMDVGVDPDYRNQGIAREIYRARQETCIALGLQGQITVGMPNGYGNHADSMGIEEYCERLLAGELSDPTVSTQQKLGFELKWPIFNYLDDPQCGNAGILMVMSVDKVV